MPGGDTRCQLRGDTRYRPLAFLVLMTKLLKSEAERRSFVKDKKEQNRNVSKNGFTHHKSKAEDESRPRRWTLRDPRVFRRTHSTIKSVRGPTVSLRPRMGRLSTVMVAVARREDAGAI